MSEMRYRILDDGVYGIPYKVKIEMYNVEKEQKKGGMIFFGRDNDNLL